MERIAYTLLHPIETIDPTDKSEKRIAELSLAPRVKGRHMRATDGAGGPVQAKLALIASLARISRDVADELDEIDIVRIDALYDEESDLALLAQELGLPPRTSFEIIRARIAEVMAAKGLTVPLDGGAGRPADGPETGQLSPAT